MTEADRLRALWRQHFEECDRISAENDARHERFMSSHAAGVRPIDEGRVPYPSMPHELRGLQCGAKNRRGLPCKQSDLGRNGRCKFHGGMSTGPKSAEGKARAKANLTLRHVSAELRPHGEGSEPHEMLLNVKVAGDVVADRIADPKACSEPHADLIKPEAAPLLCEAGASAPEADPEPHGVTANESIGGMSSDAILASIAAIAAKRRARK